MFGEGIWILNLFFIVIPALRHSIVDFLLQWTFQFYET